MKKITNLLVISMIMVVAIAGVVSAEYTISLGHGTLEKHPTHFGVMRFKELVEERTNGDITVNLFPNRQLGEERELVEGLQMGTVDMAVVSTGPLGGFVPEINVLDLPFLFKNNTHAYGVFDGPIGEELLGKFEDVGIVGAAIWENGWRNVTSNKPIESPADLEGVKIRTMENEIHMAAFEKLGASPVPMVWGEVYTSLQQGVIDAQENPVTIIYVNNLWEVQDYVQMTGHVYGPHVFLMSQLTLDSLPDEYQEIVLNTAREVSTYQRMMSAKLEAEQKEMLIENGMNILDVDKEPFQKAVMSVLDQYKDRFGSYIDRILAAGGN